LNKIFKNNYKLIFLVIGSIVFIYLVANLGLKNIIENISKTGVWFIPIILVWFIIYLLNTFTWFIAQKNDSSRIKYSTLLSIHISSSAINYLTPIVSLGGEPYRILNASEYMDDKNAVSSTLLYNIFHVLSHLIFWSICCLISLMIFRDGTMFILSLIIFVVLSAVIFLFIVGFRKGFLSVLLNLFKGRLIFKKLNNYIEKKEAKILIVDKSIRGFYSNKRKYFYVLIFSELLARIAASAEIYFILYSINIVISPFQAIYIYGAMSLFLNLLFFIPMETGTKEVSLYYIVGTLGISSQIGIYVSLVSRIREFFWIIIGMILIKLNKSKTSKK
jgi:uncharacterized protein (TIRG00374 family)